MPNKNCSLYYKLVVCIDCLGLILLKLMVVPPTDFGRALNDRCMIPNSPFANFLIIIHET